MHNLHKHFFKIKIKILQCAVAYFFRYLLHSVLTKLNTPTSRITDPVTARYSDIFTHSTPSPTIF